MGGGKQFIDFGIVRFFASKSKEFYAISLYDPGLEGNFGKLKCSIIIILNLVPYLLSVYAVICAWYVIHTVSQEKKITGCV